METRIVNIETKFENLSTNLETLIEKSDIKRQQQADEEMNKYQTRIDKEAKNNRHTINQIQDSLKQLIFLQQSINESNSPTSTTSNRTNRSNKSDDTKDSAKRKIDLLSKGKTKQITKRSNKYRKRITKEANTRRLVWNRKKQVMEEA